LVHSKNAGVRIVVAELLELICNLSELKRVGWTAVFSFAR
jgi:hypothetical protein